MNRITRCLRSAYVTPLSKSINSRHLALEPLCCIQSCRIRSGCYAVGIFELIGIICILAYSLSKLTNIFSTDYTYNSIGSYLDFGEHPSPYLIILIACLAWSLSIGLFVLGVKRFHARFVQAHLFVQLASVLMGLIIVVCVAIRLAIVSSRSTDHGAEHEHSRNATETTGGTGFGKNGRRGGTLEEIGLLTCSLYVIALQIWGFSVVYDCYKYFKLCQVLVQLGGTRRAPAASTNGNAADNDAGGGGVPLEIGVAKEALAGVVGITVP